jgi:RNA polymerase sigma-70 factor (ECF subfamily)
MAYRRPIDAPLPAILEARGATADAVTRPQVNEIPPLDDGGSDPAPGGNETSDHELIRGAQRGEEHAFEMLVRRHEERAMRVALALVANREDAKDLAQEAFLRVFRNLERFDFEHEFTTWLYRIVTNLAIDLLRKRRPAMSTSAEEEEEADLDLADPDGAPPSRPLEQMETAERVRACIDRLAPHFRSVMILRELEGLPCTEIARIVGTTHVTVRWRLHRGRKLFLEEWERMENALSKKATTGPDDANGPEDYP